MEKELRLNTREKALFEQLAAKTRPNPTVSYDIAEYINNNEAVYNTVAFAQKQGVDEADWQRFLDIIKRKYY